MYRLLLHAAIAALVVISGAGAAGPRGLPEQVVPRMFGPNCGPKTDYTKQDVALIADAGFRFVRSDFQWLEVEKVKNTYDFSAYDGFMEKLSARGIRPLFMLAYANPLYDNNLAPHTAEARAAFAAFAAAAAARYKGRGVIWEIWNEPDLSLFWRPSPNADDYVALAKQTSAAIKKADPGATVIGPAVSGGGYSYLEKCVKLGLLEALDAVSVHPYRSTMPETAIADYSRVRELIAGHAPGGKEIPIISGEWGYHSLSIGEEKQAQYLVRMFLTNLICDVRLSIWYGWGPDPPDSKNAGENFGMVRFDLKFDPKPKPSYIALQTLARELGGCRFVSRRASKDDEYILLFKGPKGYRLAAWTTGDERETGVPLLSPKVVMVSMDGKRSPLMPGGPDFKLKLSQSPVYVEAIAGKAIRR